MISKALLTFLTTWIVSNTEFSQKVEPPPFFQLTKKEMSDKACYSSKNCRVKAYYVKNKSNNKTSIIIYNLKSSKKIGNIIFEEK